MASLPLSQLPASRASNVRGRRANAAVLQAATHLFAERGYMGTSIADVAAASGVAKPSVLYHYPDKDSLWKAVVSALWTEVDSFFEAHYPRGEPPSRARLELLSDLFVRAALRWPAYVRIPFIEGASPSWRSDWLVDRYFGRHVMATDALICALQSIGEIGPGDPAHYQALISSMVNVFVAQGAMWDRAYGRALDGEEALRAAVALAIDRMFAK
jgi:TetR/AcrR family transcriptional regulator